MKKIVLISALVFINISLIAQSHNIGLKYIGAPQSDEFSIVGYDYKKNNGYSGVGISYDYYSKSNFTIGTELTFNNFRDYSKVFGLVENEIVKSMVDYKRQFQYVSIPVKLGYKFNLGKKVFVQPSIGVISSYLLKAKTINDNESFDPVKLYKRFDVLGLADLSVGYNLTSKIALTGSYRYQFKLSNKGSLAVPNSPISTSRGNFTIGLNFELH
jgi:Outer membrane protein beta-barrel domain